MIPSVRLADTHAHLMDARFAENLPEVLDRAREAGVAAILCVGYDLATSRAAVELARAHRAFGVRAAVGIHPNEVARSSEGDFQEIERLAREPEVVAIGETGLDYYRDRTPRIRQQEALEWHLRLAEALHLPVIIHNRQADPDVARLLESSATRRPYTEPPGVLHCFSSTDADYLRRLLAAGYYVSFAGPLTFRNAGELPAMAALVPPDRLLVETDCPYLTPEPHRGRRNEPAYLRHTAQRLADLRGLPLQALAERMWSNTVTLLPAFQGVSSPSLARTS